MHPVRARQELSVFFVSPDKKRGRTSNGVQRCSNDGQECICELCALYALQRDQDSWVRQPNLLYVKALCSL